MPRIKAKAATTANAQAVATGQIVDTISNINVVKIFANSKHEDSAALKAFGKLRKNSLSTVVNSFGFELL